MDETLIDLVKQVRGKTLRLLGNVEEPAARFAPAGLSNTLLWHAGHALVVTEQLGMVIPFGTTPSYPAGWFEIFGWNSKPAEVKTWPTLAEVVTQLTSQRDRLVDFLSGIEPSRLAEEIGEAPQRQPRRSVIVHGFHDEACHQGEMYLLRKLWKVQSGA